jgi:hypothetical protein
MKVKPKLLVAACCVLLIPVVKLRSQVASSSPPNAIIRGSEHPELIPDAIAYHFVLLSLSLPTTPTATDIIKRDLRLKRLGLAPDDANALKSVLTHFSTAYAYWQSTLSLNDPAAAISDRDEIVNSHLLLIEQRLTPGACARLKQYVQGEKAKMYVPKPQ